MEDEQRHRVPPRMTERARCLRGEATFPERLLWTRLRNRQVGGAKLRRQHVIGPYVVDFFCPQRKLVIELDGHSHDTTAPADLEREKYLQQQGLRVIRFGNDEVIRDVDRVAEAVCGALEEEPPR